MSGRRSAALVLLAAGAAIAAIAWRRMPTDPIRAALAASTAILATLLSLFVAGGGVLRASNRLRGICLLAGCGAILAAGGGYVFVDRVVQPELEDRRARLARARVPEGPDLRASAERLGAAKGTLPWIAAGAAVCTLSAAIAPWKSPSKAAGGCEGGAP